MQQLPRIFCFLVLLAFSSAAAQALTVGAYWAFQEEQDVGPLKAGYNSVGNFSNAVNVTNWPNGIPSFDYSGTSKITYNNYATGYTAYDGSTWGPGQAFGWDTTDGSSAGNSFEVTLDTTGVEDISARFKYRLNGVQSSAGLVLALSAFEYSVDGGGFISVPGVSLALSNNDNYNNEWSADLSTATAIENAVSITLRWTLPDLVQISDGRIRVDDLELLGSYDPVNYTNSSSAVLELRTQVKAYTPSTFSASTVSYNLSGADADDFEISTSGALTFKADPVYANQPSYSVVVEMTDSQDPSKLEHETVTVSILKSAAITSRERHHPAGQYNVLFIPVDDLRPLLNVYGEDDPLKPITINGESGTPNFDRLAASGVTFLNAHCQQAICTASRVSFLTGLRPDTTRNWNLESKFRDIMPHVVTLPQHFSKNGYKTYGVGKIFHGQSNNHQDDDHITGADSWSDGWQNPSNANGVALKSYYERGDNTSSSWSWPTWDKRAAEDAGPTSYPAQFKPEPNPTNSASAGASATDVGEYKADGITTIEDIDYKDGRAAQLAIGKIAEYAISGEPFFLGLGFQKPHLPFNAPKKYWDLYDPRAIVMSNYLGVRSMPNDTNSFTAPYGGEPSSYGDGETYLPTTPDLSIFYNDRMPNVESAQHLIHGYMACVSFIDTQLGKVLDALEDPNGDGSNADSITDNTIVILFGDHGFHLGDHGAFWAKHSNYEISTRVPFIIRSPGMSALGTSGTTTNAPVELVDVFPTLLDLCSLPVPDETTRITAQDDTELYQVLEGTTLLPLLEDSQQPWKSAAYSQYQRRISYNSSYATDAPLSAAGGKGMGYSIRTDRYRYTEWWRTKGNYGKFGVTTGSNPYDPDASRVVSGINQASFVELYDYQNDPHETENLAYKEPEDYAALISELQALLHDSDNIDYVGDGWKKDLQASPYNVPASYPVTKSQWSTRHQTPGRSASDFADAGDPDQDGIPNLMEYAMGTHPLEQNTAQVSMSHSAGVIAIQYPEVTARSDVSLIPETSASLETSGWSTVSATTIDTAGSKRMKEASLPTAGGAGFLRLRAVEE